MHNFVYLAQRRSQEFSCEPNFWGGRLFTHAHHMLSADGRTMAVVVCHASATGERAPVIT